MHTVDVVAGGAAGFGLLLCAAVLARQRYMLRVHGGIPLAVRLRGNRWVYGVARYAGGELRWYRSFGLGTRPSRVLRRSELQILGHRPPNSEELRFLPATIVVVECRVGTGADLIGIGESAFTGFISWLEASAPKS